MPDADETQTEAGNGAGPEQAREVLASLPRTRPGRTSAKRTAARAKSTPSTPGRTTSSKRNKPSAAKRPAATSASTRRRAASPPPVPPAPQGYEAEPRGGVTPPSGAELVSFAVETAGEVAQAGLHVSGRLLRGVLSRLPRP